MQGILLVDKPVGWTSFDVVNYVRKIVANAENKKPRQIKVGHTGTLDPFATGLLVLLIGKEYTARQSELLKSDKTYEVTMRLGVTSSTGDPEGELKDTSNVEPGITKLQSVIEKFTGEIEQVPPAYSAIKIDGVRAYKHARAGREVNIKARRVTINTLDLIEYKYPEVKLIANVSSGTYIRALVEDIGKALGNGAYTSALRRTKNGNYSVDKAINVKDLVRDQITKTLINFN